MTLYNRCDYYDCTKDDDVTLEPRLNEYLKKKKYFQENDIQSEHLEKEYTITDKDMIKIRAHIRNDKKNSKSNEDLIDPTTIKELVEDLEQIRENKIQDKFLNSFSAHSSIY